MQTYAISSEVEGVEAEDFNFELPPSGHRPKKLTPQDVREIRRRYVSRWVGAGMQEDGLNVFELAELYAVNMATIYDVVNRKTHRDIV